MPAFFFPGAANANAAAASFSTHKRIVPSGRRPLKRVFATLTLSCILANGILLAQSAPAPQPAQPVDQPEAGPAPPPAETEAPAPAPEQPVPEQPQAAPPAAKPATPPTGTPEQIPPAPPPPRQGPAGLEPAAAVGIGPTPTDFPPIPRPDPQAVAVPPGFTAEVVAANLVYPTSVEFDDLGLIYVAESGASYGDEIAPARILRFDPLRPNQRQVVAEQLSGPVTDILWHQGRLYISQRGKISVLLPSGPIVDLVQGLPSLGNHPNGSLAVGPDGKIYFGQGTATNSGIVGFDNFQMGWLQKYPEVHDIPAHDIRVRGQAIQTPDPLTFLRTGQAQTVMTSAFQPFGSAVQDGTMLAGQVKSNGTILRMNPDGSNLEVYAWGLRNPFGIGFLPDGRLLATDAGYDDNGSRPIANAPDVLWNIRAGAWYGFPDFAAGIPVTDPRFRSTRGPAPEFLLAEHPPVETPLATLPPHTVATKFDLSPGGAFGNRQLYLALFGDLAPTTGEASQHPGSSVSRLDMNTQEVVPFLRTKRASLGPPGFENAATAGLKRPIDAKFSPDGSALYVVDFGAIATVPSALGARPRPFPGTGALWRITATGMTAALPSGTRRTFFRGPQVYQGVQLPVSSSVYTLDGTYLYPPVWHYDPTGTLVP